MKLIYCLMAATLLNLSATAQDKDDDTDNDSKRKKRSIVISTDKGFKIETLDSTDKDGVYVNIDSLSKHKEKPFEFEFFALDLGINTLDDKTNYAAADTRAFLHVPENMKNDQLFSLRSGKSWNVNIWPVLFKARLAKGNYQKVYISSGVGLQMYNFRFTKDISYLNNTVPEVYHDTISFSKNKLGPTYLSVPLALTLKTKLTKKAWLVYGAGVTGGYRISSWMKQVSGERGKDKNHDAFNFNDFNACVTGEIGVSGIFRLYATYQLTALHETALDQHPFCVGLRFGGI